MTTLKLLLFGCLIFPSSLSSASDFLYTAISQDSIRPYSTYSVVTTVEKSNSPIKFKFVISSSDNETIASIEDVVQNQEQKTIDLNIGKLEDRKYNLSIKAFPVESEDSSATTKEERIILRTDLKNTSILIQTDKPIYKPGETVKFRVLILNRYFQPFGNEKYIDLTIMDPQSNIIKSWKNVEINGTKGFISDKFELSSEPNLGEWTIETVLVNKKEKLADLATSKPFVESNESSEESNNFTSDSNPSSPVSNSDSESTKVKATGFEMMPPLPYPIHPVTPVTYIERESFSFSVDQYVLPKFKVELNLDPVFVTYNDSKLTAEVVSTYTFGKPVKGKCSLILKNLNYYYGEADRNKIKEVQRSIDLEEGKGRAFVEFDVKKDLQIAESQIQNYGKSFSIFTSCQDSVSGKIRNETVTFKMFKFPYKIELVSDSTSKIEPGMPFNLTIKVTCQADFPIGDNDPKALKIEHGFDQNAENSVLYKSIPENGLVSLQFQVPTNSRLCYNEGIEVTYKDLKQTLYTANKHVSATGNYMQLELATPLAREGEEIIINLKSSKIYPSLNILLISRGKVILTEYKKFNTINTSSLNATTGMDESFKIKLPKYSAPKVKLVAYTISPSSGNDVIADSLAFDVQPDRKNELDLSLSAKSSEPGSKVSLTIKGLPNSIFGLRAVDQSVLLLKKDNDLTYGKLTSVAKQFESPDNGYWAPYIYQQFTSAGLNILTNAEIERSDRPYNNYPIMTEKVSYDMPMPVMGLAPVRLSAQSASGGSFSLNRGPSSSSPPRVRSNFPESWIWEEIDSPDGQTIIEKTVPDTITSWTISGFQINQAEGLGLTSTPQKLTVFRPFFIYLNLPYSIVKGEVLLLQVIVHNYLETPVEASITLDNSEGFFKFLKDEKAGNMTESIKLNASSITSVTFPISPLKFGLMKLKVVALSDSAGDAVSRNLIVKPPGIKHTQNNAVLINLLESSEVSNTVSATFPAERVPEADSLKVSVIGDILGGTMNNLDKLIQLPSGCGEQNMLHFVPDIVILDYLTATGQLTPELKKKTIQYLEKGYQQQLTYLRFDGSFSAFGKSDLMGSTWLTAFVTRSFISAKKYITIDENVLNRSLKFLINEQNDNGSFAEEGRVHDKSLQGGAGKNQYALTAFVLLTFVEAERAKIDLSQFSNETTSTVLRKGSDFLLNGTSQGQLKDSYGINLISYLLQEISHPQAEAYFNMTKDFVKINSTTNTQYWEPIVSRKSLTEEDRKLPIIYRQWESQIKPASVEATSYALLSYLLRQEISDSFSIARWLMKQRNAEGGFISTQDTVVGITALAKFAEAIQTKKNSQAEMSIDVLAKEGGSIDHSFYIGKDNRTTLQEYILPLNVDNDIELKAKGKGTALAQLSWSYYIEAKDTSPAFELDIDIKGRDKGRNLDMRICSSVIKGEESNMAILEVNAPSGYVFDQEELETLRIAKQFQRYELENKDSKLNLYFNSITAKVNCLELQAYRVYLVANHVNGTALLYDYYDTTRRALGFYKVPSAPLCDLCNVDNSCEIQNCA